MRKLIPISTAIFIVLGVGAEKASAWWLLDKVFCHHGCCGNVCVKQYNAFSPFCCEGSVPYNPYPGYFGGGSAALSFAGGAGYPGELPAPGTFAGQNLNVSNVSTSIAGPPTVGPVAMPTQANGAAPIPPGISPRIWNPWAAGVPNPNGVPGYYSGFNLFNPYGQ